MSVITDYLLKKYKIHRGSNNQILIIKFILYNVCEFHEQTELIFDLRREEVAAVRSILDYPKFILKIYYCYFFVK